MATPPNPPPGGNPSQFTVDPSEVRYLDEMALKWTNLLKVKLDINNASREQKDINKEIAKLQGQEAQNALNYKRSVAAIGQLEKNLQRQRAAGNRQGAIQTQRIIDMQKQNLQNLAKTTGGALRAQEVAAAKQKANLQAERDLIKDINKQRGLGGRIMDLFRTKEQRQRQVDVARAKAGGGANVLGKGGGSDKGAGGDGSLKESALAAAGPYGAIAAAALAAVEKLKAPFKMVGKLAKQALTAPFADAASLLTGESYGIGGGGLRTTGASSILGGMKELASSIPFVGGILGGLVGIFQSIVEAVLGIEQGMFRAARAMNTSVGNVQRMTNNFRAMVASSNNLALNETRMLESQVEISSQLGINKQLSGDILANNVLLKEVAGLEAESRQSIAESSIITGKNATKLTQSIMGTVGAFNKVVGTSFTFKAVIQEASKVGGVLGLTFTKYPEKITKAVLTAKTLGMELKQLDSIASGLLDFESSISKEMEAQVLTGKDMNLTKAREAALNNDYATLSKEVTKNVGDANYFLSLNRIQQEGIAESVGMTANSLADVLKKQQLYSKLGATDLKGFHEKIDLLERQGKKQEEISKLIGQDAYNEYTRLSTAEKISEVMEKIKLTFIAFVKSSGLFDFITNPQRVNEFIKSATNMLAGAIGTIGDIIATILDGIGSLPFTDTAKWRGLAEKVRGGTGTIAGGIKASTANLGGTAAPSVGGTVETGTRQQQTTAQKEGEKSAYITVVNKSDDGKVTKKVHKQTMRSPGSTSDNNSLIIVNETTT